MCAIEAPSGGSVPDSPAEVQSENGDRAMIDSMPMMAWRCRPDGFVEFVNRRWLEYTGLATEQALGWGWTAAIHPDDLEGLTNRWREILASEQPGEIEARMRRCGGEYRWFLIRVEPARNGLQDIVKWYGISTDIEDRRRAESLRAAEKSTLEMIADGASLKDVLNHLCSSIDAQASPSVTTILLMDPDRKRLWHSAGPLAPREWISVVSPVAVAMDAGLCGTAAFLKQRVIVTDVATDPNWPDQYRELAIRNAIRAAWSQPILTKDNQVLGTFAVYCPDSRVPSDADLALVDGARSIARIAIERQRSQQALKSALDEIRGSEARLRRVIDAIPTLAWCNLPDGSNEYLNKRWHDYTGLTPEESRGWGWQPSFHPEDLPRLMDRWRELLASGEPGEIEARLRRHDGVFRWFLIRVEPLRDETGKIIRWYGTSTDIEDRKQAEEKLRQDESELRRMTDAIAQTIVVQDPNGIPIYANQAVLDYTGLTIEDVLNSDFRARIFHPEDLERLRERRRVALSRDMPFEIEQRARRKDGQYRWFLIRYNPFRDEQGRVVRWYATGTDIEDRKRAEDSMRSENLVLREEIDRSSMFEEIIGSSAPLRHVLSQVAKVAQTDSTVLLLGETGTGKELIARAIHKQSGRSARAFIRVNCGAIPTSLVASELFGHEKGSFTGAVQQRLGRFEAANGGTIFLDEVGDLPAETQIALLRVLQEREIERVGSIHPIPVDVRVLAATNRDLQLAITDGTFRRDIFYRLNVFPIRMPSLRERGDDIPLLAEYLIERYAKRTGKKIRSIGKTTLDLFRRYDWPGNIRELQNVIERAVILSEGETLNVDGTWFQPHDKLSSGPIPPSAGSLGQSERIMIETALTETHGQVGGPSGAAAKLGLARQTLESKIKALKIDKFRFKSSLTGRELRAAKHR
jgi:PAS domain S-box-containing protein